tara:strand:- start:451 stop:2016 length:1566 start_codon:yes stop_codon:yes gene_type:complete
MISFKNILFNFFLFFFIFVNQSFASTNMCDDVYESLRTNGKNLELFNPPLIDEDRALYGILWDEYLDNSGEFKFVRDKNNNISIFSVAWNSPNYDTIKSEDTISKINDQLVSNLSSDEINNILADYDKLNITIQREVNNEIIELNKEIEKTLLGGYVNVNPTLRINAFKNINIKESEYTINYNLDTYWEDKRFIEIFRNVYENNFGPISEKIEEHKLENPDYSNNYLVSGIWCQLTNDEFLKENLFIWSPDLKFINLVKKDIENSTKEFFFQYEFYPDGEEFVWIKITENAEAIFTSFVDFSTFPFDKHQLEFILADTQSGADILSIGTDQFTEIPITKQIKQKLHEWNIPEDKAFIKSYTHIDTYGSTFEGIKTYFSIERQSGYYVYKVLAPIFLILGICWSIFWLDITRVESRLTVSIVCLLTLIAYNFVIDENIPKLSYMTIMDQIVLSSYVFASIPTLISIYFTFQHQKNGAITFKNEERLRFYGPIIYILVLIFIIFLNVQNNSSTNSFVSGLVNY